MPAPFNWLVYVVICLIALVVLLNILSRYGLL